jgi:hypothetical protein
MAEMERLSDLRDERLERALKSFGLFQIVNDEVGDCIGDKYRNKFKHDIFLLTRKEWRKCKHEARKKRKPPPLPPPVKPQKKQPTPTVIPPENVEILDRGQLEALNEAPEASQTFSDSENHQKEEGTQ